MCISKGSDVRPGIPLVPWFPALLPDRRMIMCIAKGSGERPGVPPVFLGFRRFCVIDVG